MASFYIRPNSPFYWIRRRGLCGKVERFSSGIRHGQDGSLRKIQQRIGEETAKEERLLDDGVGSMFRLWVDNWLPYHYTNEGTLIRAKNAWAWVKMFLAERGVLHPEEVSYAMLHDYMRWRTSEAKAAGRREGAWNTALLEIRMFGAILQEAVRRGYLVSNPTARLGLRRKTPKEKRPVTREEEREMLGKLEGWMRDAFLVGIRQGCRISEVAVPLSSVDVERKLITFRVKGGKFHTAPLHEEVEAIARRRMEEGETVLVSLPPQPSVRFCKWFDAHGWPEISFHCLRVTVVTRLAQAGVSESKAMRYVGHASAMVHAIYRKLGASDVADLSDLL